MIDYVELVKQCDKTIVTSNCNRLNIGKCSISGKGRGGESFELNFQGKRYAKIYLNPDEYKYNVIGNILQITFGGIWINIYLKNEGLALKVIV